MASFVRLLALALALGATGVLPLLAGPERACSEGIGTDCGDGDGHTSPCRDCSPDCVLCLCCPLRAAPTTAHGMPSAGVTVVERLTPAPEHRVLRPDCAGVFHPPRS